jgi:hypothetical protein
MTQVSENINGVNAQLLTAAVHRMKHNPEMAKVTFQVQTIWDVVTASNSRQQARTS